jgi:hypothetical protein
LVTPVPLSPLLLLCCASGGGSIKISLQAMPYNNVLKKLAGLPVYYSGSNESRSFYLFNIIEHTRTSSSNKIIFMMT